MSSPTTPILGLSLMTTSQAQKEVVFNELAIAFDALFKGSVLDTTLTTPPVSPVAGDAYIVGTGATGAWHGNDGKVTFFYNGWQFANPSLKMRLYSVAQSEFFVYESDNTWTAEPASTVSVLGDLTNVTGVPTDGQVLKYQTSDGKWHPWTIAFPPLALTALSDVQVTTGSGVNGYALKWSQGDGKWELGPVLSAKPGMLTLPDVVTTGASDGKVLAYSSTIGPGSTPGVHFIDTTALTLVSALNQVGDVAYPTGGAAAIPTGASLAWTGAGWAPSNDVMATIGVVGIIDGPGTMDGHAHQTIRVNSVEAAWEYTPFTLANLNDVNITPAEGSAIDGFVLAWNNGASAWEPVAHAANALANLTDVNVTTGAGIDGWVLAWKNSDTKWEAKQLATVAVSGAYADLTGKPTLFSGAYADLTGKPALSAIATSGAYSDLTGAPSLAAVATSGGYADLTGRPTLFSGAYADLTGKPTIPTTIETLTDVQVTSVANGQALVWNSTDSKWENGNVAATASLSALTDVQLTSQSNGQALIWNATANKWENGTVSTATALSALTDVNVTEGSGIDGYVIYWKNADTKWEAKALATVAASGAYSDLTGKPTIPTTLAALTGDVNITEGSGINGYFLKWDNATSKWIASAGSAGATTLAADTDVAISSPTAGQVLAYDGASGKWKNQAQASGGFTVGTPPAVVQFGDVSVNSTAPSVTLGSAPVAGNLLVAVVYTDGSQPTAASGWTQQAISTTNLWYAIVFTKVAGASEPAGQSPVTGGSSSHWTIGMWEVSGANATTPFLTIQANFNNPGSFASTTTIPQTPSTLFLASLCASQSQTYSITRAFGIANVDANLSGAAGAQAAFGHCDSNNPVYGMLGVLSASAASNALFALISA